MLTQSCGFPDHTFDDEAFYGTGKAGAQNAGGNAVLDASTGGTGQAGGSSGGASGNENGGGGTGTGGAPGDGGAGSGGERHDAGPVGKGDGSVGGASTGGAGGAGAGGGGPVDSGLPEDAGPTCDPGLTICAGACWDIQTDPTHCGGCFTQCSGGNICKDGNCVPPCDPGLTLCGGVCVDTNTDEAHCGGCNKPQCPANYLCQSGACVIDCGTFTSCVPGTCTDTKTDDKHCGNCQTDCTTSGKICSGGVCQLNCSFPYTFCNGSCVNYANDDANCNGCGHACAASEACINSICTKLVENCQNGVDDDRDGKVDCADTDCGAYTCAAPPAAGWTGPVAVWSGTSGTGPSCGSSGGFPTAQVNANTGLVVPPYTCPACSCAPSPGMYCDDLTFVFDTSTNCMNTDPWQAQAFTPSALNSSNQPICDTFKLCCSPPTAHSALLEKPLASYVHGTCTPSQATPSFPATSWGTDVLGCAAPPSSGGGCGTGGQCYPKPQAPFGSKLCVWRTGGPPAAGCPADYPNLSQQYYQTTDDTRSCSACSCNGSCGGTIKTYTDNNCTVGAATLNLNGTPAACTTVPGDTTITGGSDTRSYTFTGAGPVCGSTPSTLQGSVQPDGLITMCCQ